MRLAIFIDQVFWFDGSVYSTDEAYILFAASFCNLFDEVVFIGRLAPEPGTRPYVLDHPAIKIQPLPYYPRVYSLWKEGPRLYPQIRKIIRANLPDWDVVLISGPNPIGQLIAQECVKLERPFALLVRQNLIPQVRFANRGLRRVLGVAMAGWQEWQFRRLARGRTVFTVGQEMARAYGKVTRHVHDHFACLVSQAQLATFAAMLPRSELGHLLCVGRLSSEKGHRYLFAALARLKARGIACSLDIVGSGREEAELRAEVATLGLDKNIVFHSYVPYGPKLFAFYQRATALVVPSLSGEGFPQVINEALCIGVPTIASTVGGIPAFLKHNETAVLVPPADVPALARAVEQILSRPDLRERLRRNGQALMRDNSLEANRDRMMQVIRNEVLRGPRDTQTFSSCRQPKVGRRRISQRLRP